MNKTKIPWCDYTINPVKGLCPMACSYCYARRMYKRFKWNPEIRLDEMAIAGIESMKAGSKIFWGSTIELFHDSIPWEYLQFVFGIVNCYPKLIHIVLTKQPQNLIKWSPFPENCWVGVTATGRQMWFDAIWELLDVKAAVKFISFEPLLDWTYLAKETGNHQQFTADWFRKSGINWLIIGSQTAPVKHPPREWVDEIITAADKAKIPVFVKEPMASHYNIQRQEFPTPPKEE
ncbi:MAG: phage Gp37/Gp68 family protein [Gammaproteobacteria bacterium]|nr:phage Gp37/Gp68 family protein [Gammaproteobacteria bacterium]